MKEYGLYVWVNEGDKTWAVTNKEDDILVLLTTDGEIKEFHFTTVQDRLNFEKQLDKDGYLYNSLGAFLIGIK